MDYFEGLYEEDTISRGNLQTDHIKELQDKHGSFISKKEFELPFCCDDHNLKGACEGTNL
jgi:hypothetical protein